MDATLTRGLPAGSQSLLIRAIKVAVPLLLSAAVAWGSVQFIKGRDAQRLDTVEKNVEHSLTREEFKFWTDEQRERLREINQRLIEQEKRR